MHETCGAGEGLLAWSFEQVRLVDRDPPSQRRALDFASEVRASCSGST
ncbi:hypothetical protein [Actinomycetospora chlora]